MVRDFASTPERCCPNWGFTTRPFGAFRRTGADSAWYGRLRNRHAKRGFRRRTVRPGQPLDASRYFIILPDAIGTGKSAKPSDGLRAKFPQYNYDDMARRNTGW